jgi:4-aminobutyrate aminotransferase / (S)-3-amino-2-methylpropionate transaminase / 5-aminovalerate transaminase
MSMANPARVRRAEATLERRAGPRGEDYLARLERFQSPGLHAGRAHPPVVWERASGTRVWDVEGRSYLDLTAGFGVAAVGHAHPEVAAAVARQARELPHAMGDVHPARITIELLERLAELVPPPLALTHLGVTGSDAVEAALKTAVLATGRPGALAFAGAYHGLSYGALPLTDRMHFRAPFAAQLAAHVEHAPWVGPDDAAFGVIESILASRRIGAVILEPIQGRGGIRPAPRGLLPALSTLCRQHGALLIADEIFTGFGRTGQRFAVEEDGVVPDILLVGKALAGGLPISAAIGSEAAMGAWRGHPAPALHTSTFLGHPLAAAAAHTVLDIFAREDLVGRAARLGAVFQRRLGAALLGLPGVAAVRGRGLLAGIVLANPETGAPDGERALRVMGELAARGVLVLTAGAEGEVIELSPPLVISEAELEEGITALAGALAAVPPR